MFEYSVCQCCVCVKAGLRAVHDLGPEIRRAISGTLEEDEFPEKDAEEPMHRVGDFIELGRLYGLI